MTSSPLNLGALRAGAAAIVEFQHQGSPWKAPWGDMGEPTRAHLSKQFAVGVSAYLAVARSEAATAVARMRDMVAEAIDNPGESVHQFVSLPDLYQLLDHLAVAQPESEDERIPAWHAVASHPAFEACYDESRTLLASMLDRLTALAARPVVNSVDELVTTPAGRALANASFNEGLSAGIMACNDSLDGEPFVKPVSPYRPEVEG